MTKIANNRLNTQAFAEAANSVHEAAQKIKSSRSLAGVFQDDDGDPFLGSVMGDIMESFAYASRYSKDDVGMNMSHF